MSELSDDWELEMRACNAANSEQPVAVYQQLVRDLWRAYCEMEERVLSLSPPLQPLPDEGERK